MTLAFLSMDILWRNALAAIPVAVAVWLLGRCLPCRPSTRHAMWLIVLLVLLAPPNAPSAPEIHQAAKQVQAHVKQWWNTPMLLERPIANDPTVPPSTWLAMPPESLSKPQSAISRSSTSMTDHHREPASGRSQIHVRRFNRPYRVLCRNRCRLNSFTPRTKQNVSDEFERGRMQPLDYASASTFKPNAQFESDANASPSPDKIAATIAQPSTNVSADIYQWWARLLAVRDAVVRISPLPAMIWLGGSALVLLVVAIRIQRFRRLIRAARPAPDWVQAEVAETARVLKLSRVPQAMMVDRRLSPMVWCGRSLRLILPRDLWHDLDELGRSAVLMHELAHLKRRDHWVCWLELFIGVLYWWHPMVWWIRARLRDEADLCCDAWVTALLPRGRRAYAGALLVTQTYINDSGHAVPAVGLGVTNKRTKRFARRLTMVMTQRSMPRLSLTGTALAFCLATAAWLSTPLWACPPEEKPVEVKQKQKQKTPKPHRVKVPQAHQAPTPPPTPDAAPGSTFERYMEQRDGAPRQPAPPAQPSRLRRSGAVAIAPGAPGTPGAVGSWLATAAPSPMADAGTADRLAQLEERLNMLTEHLAQLAGGHARQPMPSESIAPSAGPSAMGSGSFFPGEPGDGDGDIETRIYHLPDGKLEALYELMARQDVPIFVSNQGDAIAVQARRGSMKSSRASST